MFGGRKRTCRQKSRLGGTRKRRNRRSRGGGYSWLYAGANRSGVMTPGRYLSGPLTLVQFMHEKCVHELIVGF
jgi:hypothetical protein